MLKIIAGERRGANLATLEGLDTRPLRSRVREALFNILRNNVPAARVLDCFGGSGAVGLEALSRGAAHAVFVDASPAAVRVIDANVRKLRYEDRTEIVARSVPGALKAARTREPFTLVFIMPPYGSALEFAALDELASTARCAPDAMVVVEIESGRDWPAGKLSAAWTIVDDRAYGVTRLVFLKPAG